MAYSNPQRFILGRPTGTWINLEQSLEEQAVHVATQYAPAPLLPPWAPKCLARRRADAT